MNRYKIILRAALFCFLLSAFCFSASAQPTSLNPYQPNYITTPANLIMPGVWTNPGSITLSNVSSFTLTNGQMIVLGGGGYDTIRQYNGESLLASCTWTNPLVVLPGGVTTWWDVTADGTNFTTTHPFVWTIPNIGGSNTAVAWTNLNFLTIDNVRQIKLWAVSNNLVGVANAPVNSNSVTINWFEFSRSQEIKY